MCDKITKIANQSKYQWIGVCAHGTAHLFWRTTLVSFPFEKLDALMSQALKGKLPVEYYGGDYLIWLNQVAIKLTEKDYLDMLELFASAAEAGSRPMMQAQFEPSSLERRAKTVLH